jgi:hypothetical protein
MKTPCEILFSIDKKTILLQFEQIDSPTSTIYVHLPAYDEERLNINKLLMSRFKELGTPSSEIPSEPFPLGYSLSDLTNDLKVLSSTEVSISVGPEKLALCLMDTIVIWHLEKFGRLLRNDLETYVTVCVSITCAFKNEYFWSFEAKRAVYDNVTLAIREKYFETYVHTDLIQL